MPIHHLVFTRCQVAWATLVKNFKSLYVDKPYVENRFSTINERVDY